MKLLFSSKIVGFIPSAVLVESSAVGTRLTGSKKFGVNLAKRIEKVCTVSMMKRFWIEPLRSVHNTEPVGLTALLTCAILTNMPLFTDDRKLHSLCEKAEITTYLLNDIIK
jgi:hypothetical protein